MRRKVFDILFIIIILIIFAVSLSQFFTLTKKQEAALIKEPAKKYMVLVDIEACKLYLIENGQCIKQYLVAPGKYSTPSPTGLFKIVNKDTWGEGFGGRWMGLNVPWGTLV